MTDLAIIDIKETINLGRKRWKIENEGFNIQKNETFNIGHLYSKEEIYKKVNRKVSIKKETLLKENNSYL